MPREQRATLRAAIEHGYYETPREITISELAAVLDVPQSTVSYRLRQAEAQLAKGYLHRSDDTVCCNDVPVQPQDGSRVRRK